MVTFRLAMRHYSIKKEFELDITASTPMKYRGYCKEGDCPWRIHARVEVQGASIVIACFLYLSIFFVCSGVSIADVFPCLLVAGDIDD
jgi:hypothetical protein